VFARRAIDIDRFQRPINFSDVDLLADCTRIGSQRRERARGDSKDERAHESFHTAPEIKATTNSRNHEETNLITLLRVFAASWLFTATTFSRLSSSPRSPRRPSA